MSPGFGATLPTFLGKQEHRVYGLSDVQSRSTSRGGADYSRLAATSQSESGGDFGLQRPRRFLDASRQTIELLLTTVLLNIQRLWRYQAILRIVVSHTVVTERDDLTCCNNKLLPYECEWTIATQVRTRYAKGLIVLLASTRRAEAHL